MYMHNARTAPYFGLIAPADRVELFAPDIISGPFDERMISFLNNGTECYFQIRGVPQAVVFFTRLTKKGWTLPETAFFSGRYFEEYTFSSDGNTLVFTSDKPVAQQEYSESEFYLWKAERHSGQWTVPVILDSHFKGAGYPSITDNGNIYFFDTRIDGYGKGDIYMSEFAEGSYKVPICLPESINSASYEVDPFIAPDESYLIFASDRNGKGGLYISFNMEGAGWSDAIYMGDDIGRGESICPFVSSDGKYLLFTSKRSVGSNFNRRISYREKINALNSPLNGSNNIYFISAGIIDSIRNDNSENR